MNIRLSWMILFVFIILSFCGIFYFVSNLKMKNVSNIDVELNLADLSEKLTHLSIIMDGNRRWAKDRNLMPWDGHRAGLKGAEMAIDFALQYGIKFLSLYVFSLENLSRSQNEKDFLFDLAKSYFSENKEILNQKGVKVLIIGDRDLFPSILQDEINEIQALTSKNTQLTLGLLFCYGGKQEILDAARKIHLQNDSMKFENFLWSKDLPDVDLIIRTGKRERISNLLPWQSAYAEIHFLDILWPDIDSKILEKSCANYLKSMRSFGQ